MNGWEKENGKETWQKDCMFVWASLERRGQYFWTTTYGAFGYTATPEEGMVLCEAMRALGAK